MTGRFKKISTKYKYGIIVICCTLVLFLAIASLTVHKIFGRTLIEYRIHQKKEIIRLSPFTEMPQFAIWLEASQCHQANTVFVTSRVGKGDWEGKANVLVVLPKWFGVFRGKNSSCEVVDDEEYSVVKGATPKDDYSGSGLKLSRQQQH